MCPDLSKKSKDIEPIYLYPSERLVMLFQQIVFHRGFTNNSRDIED